MFSTANYFPKLTRFYSTTETENTTAGQIGKTNSVDTQTMHQTIVVSSALSVPNANDLDNRRRSSSSRQNSVSEEFLRDLCSTSLR